MDLADASPDTRAILAEVERFATRVIAPRAARPEAPMGAAELGAVMAAAREMGLVEGDGALWEEGEESTLRSALVIRAVARVNAGAAAALHRAAAAARLASTLGLDAAGEGALVAHGRLGIGRGALARWLAGEALGEEDRALLADVYAASGERLLTASPGFAWVLAPVLDEGGLVQWARLPREELAITPHPQAHGMDELVTLAVRARGAAPRTSLDAASSRARLAEALTLDALGLVATALGAAEHGHALAVAHAGTRRQGGALLADHAAVQLLLASSRGAVEAVAAQLGSAARAPSLDRALALRAEAHPRLCRAANDALQVLGGTGYMRDAGAEKVLRDVNHLRATGASPAELALVLAARELGSRPLPAEPPRRALGGHLPPSHPLSLRTALAKISRLVQPLVRYAPEDPWELDTRTLPGPLAAYRRRVRAFAERHLAPVALAIDAEPHDPPGRMSEKKSAVLREAALAGFLSDLLPRPFGSTDPRLLPYPLFLPQALKTEELACADGGLMLLVGASDLGVAPIVLSGDLGAVRRFLLPAFRRSERGDPQVFAFAITEPEGGSDVEESHGAARYEPGVVARRAPSGFVLSGRKCFISGGDVAAQIVVFAALEGEGMESWTAFVVRGDAPGLTAVRTELKMGMRASGAAELLLADVFVPDEAVVGGLRGGWALNRATLNMSRIPVAGMGVGFARAATEIATAFACRARLAGRPLADYQDVQLALAQMSAETASARALTWRAAGRTQARQGEASAAKFHATDVARRVCERAMDLLGNHAVLHEERAEKALRDVRLTQIFEGTNQINRLAIIEDEQERLLAAAGGTP